MNAFKFDAISKIMAERQMTRREALARTGTGIAVGALAAAGVAAVAPKQRASAQDATPSASPVAQGDVNPLNIPMLYVQSFQSGTLEPLGD
jgi:hypothetical protein